MGYDFYFSRLVLGNIFVSNNLFVSPPYVCSTKFQILSMNLATLLKKHKKNKNWGGTLARNIPKRLKLFWSSFGVYSKYSVKILWDYTGNCL